MVMEHREIYLAGGCFWGIEHLMQQLPGVVEAQSGYANGSGAAEANYRAVCGGDTGFREAVRVVYDPARVSLEALLLAYFYVVDVTVAGRQGPDVGSQYQSGIYYEDAADAAVVERIAAIERAAAADFCVEIGPLRNFYPAEEYHQDYLQKNPFGYCHIPREEMRLLAALRIDPGDYVKPAAEVVREKLGRGDHNEKAATDR
ncbi:MAG: peptide-methionine (S)-S-oxide reductase MsrA [Firmicutes bacterium]|nr:peptide-methionine (S)-S-oxide reductase MsrA [Bacillota bacterium]